MEKLRVLGKEGKKVDERLQIQVGFWMVTETAILLVFVDEVLVNCISVSNTG